MINRREILRLLKTDDKKEIQSLLETADLLRQQNVGKQVCIHGIIEFSNYCRSLCAYCGIRADNKNLVRYRMPIEEIRDTALAAVKDFGYKMLVLQSGEDFYYDAEKLSWLLKAIRKDARCLLFLSVGNRDYETYEKLYKAGARGSLFRFETSDKELYGKLHPDCSLDERIEQLNFMKEIGYLVASGPIIGLPGQTLDILTNDIYLMKDLGVTMATMGPFIPTLNTFLGEDFFRENPSLNQRESATRESLEMTLKMIALTRLLYPKVRIPIATALEKLGGSEARIKALNGGGNAFMLSLTPPKYREYYQIYADKQNLEFHQNSKKSVAELAELIKSCGRNVCKGWGTDFTLDKQEFISLCGMNK